LGKEAAFVFDLDALFERRLSTGSEQMADLVKKISQAGHQDFDRLRGQLEKALTAALQKFGTVVDASIPSGLKGLREHITAESGSIVKQRVAFLVALARHENELRDCGLSAEANAILGLRQALLTHLASAGIWVLPGGALENYLPSYSGNPYRIAENAKPRATAAELEWIAAKPSTGDVGKRYGSLADIVAALPAKPKVEIVPVLQREIADLLHRLIMSIRSQKVSAPEEIPTALGESWTRVASFVSILKIEILAPDSFRGELQIADKFGIGKKICRFDNATQTNNPSTLALE
jgi:hypothetical protein